MSALSFRILRLFAVTLFVAAMAATVSGQDIFRASVDVVTLNVTVADGQGRFITDLEKDQFTVLENGVRQDVLIFSRENLPVALSLLIDTSASMESRMQIAQDAAVGFAQCIRPQDLVQIIDFDNRVTVAQAFTADKALLEQAIRGTQSGGMTSMYQAVYIALRELAKIRNQTREDVHRQAIVLLSDGEDTTSLIKFEDVLDLAKRSETSIYTIGLQPDDSMTLGGFREAAYVLRQLAQETGGKAFFVQKPEELPAIYGQIADEISSQYAMGFASNNPRRDGTWRRLQVQVARPNTSVRTRRGYFAPSR
ncbi:MAG: VWA domain-containing protein [Acidobacteria bacterium]|nr:VWA domain-containing protein [Acidobacteriota bacterium]